MVDSRSLRWTALIGALSLPSCGSCLYVHARPSTLQIDDGRSIQVMVHERAFGLMEAEQDTMRFPFVVVATFSGLCFDWVDSLVSAPVVGVTALLRDDVAIEGGFFGWLAAFCTPFASVTPGMIGPTPQVRSVPAELVDALRVASGSDRRTIVNQIFPNGRVVDVVLK